MTTVAKPVSTHKYCPDCDDVRPVEDFSKESKLKSGLSTYCRTHKNARTRASRRANPGAWRAQRLWQDYKITLEQYQALLDRQNGGCAICATPPDEEWLSVDHDHACCAGNKSCGKCVRGLLCRSCNLGLGLLGDTLTGLTRALEYLRG